MFDSLTRGTTGKLCAEPPVRKGHVLGATGASLCRPLTAVTARRRIHIARVRFLVL